MARQIVRHEGQKVYEWEQSLQEINIYIQPPSGVTARDIECKITTEHVTLKLKGAPSYFLNHALSNVVVVDESYWMLDDGELTINLQKMKKGLAWTHVFTGQNEMDPVTQGEIQKKMMLERFQEEHPGFDFSNAEFNGAAPDARTFMGGIH